MGRAVINPTEKKLTPTELKKLNRKKVYTYIYESRQTSKQAIAEALSLSLPTITQNLNEFIRLGLVEKNGEYESTGGRKAQIIHCNEKACIAIGVEVLKECSQIVAVDLYGNILREDTLPVRFENSESYYERLGNWINDFAKSLPYPSDRLLGVCIVLLAVVLYTTTQLARRLRFSKEDEIAIVFCGSKKSLASGIPMAKVLFPPAVAGPMVLPLLVFHQLQLMVTVDSCSSCEKLVGKCGRCVGSGAKAEFFNTCDKFARLRPRLSHRRTEHRSCPGRDACEKSLYELCLCRTGSRAISESCKQRRRTVYLS